jgi:hypothetical protein
MSCYSGYRRAGTLLMHPASPVIRTSAIETSSPMEIRIVPIAAQHVEAFHRALDLVARERKYLAFLEAPPFEATRALHHQQYCQE